MNESKREYPSKLIPENYEQKWYKTWQKNKIYLKEDRSKKPYSILMPPPNVTGILHFGHVLNHTLQDLYIRRKRMQGFDVQWMPGMDHAGIATQSRVEKELKKEGLTRHDLGREKFTEKVWEWKEKYGGIIFSQLERLGVSANWDKMLFTMDETASKAVTEVFVSLFEEGLIYKGKRIINWSPAAQTALSNEEVDFKEINEPFYTMKYKFVDSDEYLEVATVRPETIYGDVAVAVNPKDERYADKIGRKVIVPYVGREVSVIADDHANPEFGTGCVKITPAHDPNDFHVGKRHDLEAINTINPDGTMNELAGELNGLPTLEARKFIANKLKDTGLLVRQEDYHHNVGFSQRGGEQIEPYLSDQWFVNMKPMAGIALDAVDENNDAGDKVTFHPPHWKKTYEHWMNNVQDWCISRQLWWGHRIPVYYTEDGQFTAARSESEARTKLNINSDVNLRQDEDVLDTWFSSWLWPMTTHRWLDGGNNNNNEAMKHYLPSDLLVTGPDIIFFWVARMIIASKKFADVIPFKDVYLTSMIRDGKGQKLSKSLGNSPDPLNIIDKYGADAVRFTMIYLAPLGQDVRMDVSVEQQDIPSMDVGRNFANKIWNAGRFLEMKATESGVLSGDDNNAKLIDDEKTLADKWIESRLNTTILKSGQALDHYEVTEYSKLLFDFVMNDFCSWYVEIVKIHSNQSNDPQYKGRLSSFAINIFNEILLMLHPVMPFITEEIWHLINNVSDNDSISLQEIMQTNKSKMNKELENKIDLESENKFDIAKSYVKEIRMTKATSNAIDPNKKTHVSILTDYTANIVAYNDFKSFIAPLSGSLSVEMININGNVNVLSDEPYSEPVHMLKSVVIQSNIHIPLEGAVDLEAEKERLKKEAKRLEGQIMGITKKLSNERFVNNAPEQVIANERKKLADMTENLNKINEQLN
jgi:valyl-tRNA synthetase